MALGTNSSQGMLLRGIVKTHTNYGFSYGQPLYMHSQGSASVTPPSTSNSYVRVIGHQLSGSGTIYFNPDNTWVKVS